MNCDGTPGLRDIKTMNWCNNLIWGGLMTVIRSALRVIRTQIFQPYLPSPSRARIILSSICNVFFDHGENGRNKYQIGDAPLVSKDNFWFRGPHFGFLAYKSSPFLIKIIADIRFMIFLSLEVIEIMSKVGLIKMQTKLAPFGTTQKAAAKLGTIFGLWLT